MKQEFVDSKDIEEKALNCFKRYLEDSEVVSQYLAENDKEPCWDGALFVFKKGYKNQKTHLIERIPTQVKGKEVVYIQDKCKYNIDVADLKAYLHNPTIYVVCQEQKGESGRKLFYRCLLPETVKHILQGKDKQKTVSVKMNPIPESISDFEDELMLFIGNKRKQVGYADKKSISMNDVIKRGIKQFTFVAPRKMNSMELMKYLSKHGSYMYAKVDEELDIEVPIADGPGAFVFESNFNQPIRVNGQLFFDSCVGRIEDGILTIRVGEFLTMSIPMDGDLQNISMQTKSVAKTLDDTLKEAAFVLALSKSGTFSVGELEFTVKVNKDPRIVELEQKYEAWLRLKEVLNILHVTKPLILEKITKEHELLIPILEECLIDKKSVSLPGQETAVVLAELGNLRLLLWCTEKDGKCLFGDFFDETCQVSWDKENPVEATAFSYLRVENMWEKIDNIDFDAIVPRIKGLDGKHDRVYEVANQDVLAMIMAADEVVEEDNEKATKLLEKALELNLWIEGKDKDELKMMHHINTLQIIKRQREYTKEEKVELDDIMKNGSIAPDWRLAASMLLEDKEEYGRIRSLVDTDSFENIKRYAIKRYLME